MAQYCPRCGRGSWACGCFISFKEKARSVLAGTRLPDVQEPEVPKEPRAGGGDPLEALKGDDRYAALMNVRDRMGERYIQPEPRDDITRGW